MLVTNDGALLAGDIEGLVAEKLDLTPRTRVTPLST
jgi:hypothetical protein